MTVSILIGDVRKKLAELPDESVHCVVTSPPYFGLRDYGVAGQIGLTQQLLLFGVRAKMRDDQPEGAKMARTPTPTTSKEDPTEFADIVARSLPTAIDADIVLKGMARKALNKGMLTATSFDDALVAVFKEGIRLGREDAPKRAGRPKGSTNKINGAEQAGGQIGTGSGSALGSASGDA